MHSSGTGRAGPPPEDPPSAAAPAETAGETEWQRLWADHRGKAAELRRQRPLLRSMLRGFSGRCPQCGARTLSVAYLKPTRGCPACGEGFDHIRTDDFAPWISILLIGHLLVPAVISVERLFAPPFWLHLLLWGPIGVEMVLVLLPRAKGLALGLMWSLGLRGDEHQY